MRGRVHTATASSPTRAPRTLCIDKYPTDSASILNFEIAGKALCLELIFLNFLYTSDGRGYPPPTDIPQSMTSTKG